MRIYLLLYACCFCLSSLAAVTRETEWQNIPDTTKVKEVVDLAATTGGTTNYNALVNKPKVNGVELVGEKSLHDLDIQVEISDLDTIRSGASAGATAVQPSAISDMETKTSARANYQPKLVSGTNIKTVNGNSLLGSGNIEIKGGGSTNSVDGAARPLPKYLHALDFDDSYPAEAAWYYSQPQDYGACSARRVGNLLERNYDWKFDDSAEFVVKVCSSSSRFASVGVANCGTNLTEEIVTSGKPSRYYKCLPGRTVDGINENGVVAEVNVVDGKPAWRTNETANALHPLGAIRWALDNGISAGMVASNLAANIRFPQGWTQNYHWMIADETSTYIVENGEAHAVTNGVPVMTNFRLYPTRDTSGAGQERYDLLADGEPITNAWFTRAYSPTANWSSEFKSVEEQDAATNGWARLSTMEARRATGLFWQSVHTSVYDISNRVLRIAVQETDDWYVFKVPASGTDEDAVREIAEAVVAPVRTTAALALDQAATADTHAIMAQSTADYAIEDAAAAQTAADQAVADAAMAQAAADNAQNEITGHINDKNNPHEVSCQQIGAREINDMSATDYDLKYTASVSTYPPFPEYLEAAMRLNSYLQNHNLNPHYEDGFWVFFEEDNGNITFSIEVNNVEVWEWEGPTTEGSPDDYEVIMFVKLSGTDALAGITFFRNRRVQVNTRLATEIGVTNIVNHMLPKTATAETLKTMLVDANTSTNADCECISTNICKLIQQPVSNLVINCRDVYHDDELDVTFKKVVSGGRVYMKVIAVDEENAQ